MTRSISKPRQRSVPAHIVEIYGSARAFKANKRKALRALEKALLEMRRGAAYLPNGAGGLGRIQKEIDVLRIEVSEKNWGR